MELATDGGPQFACHATQQFLRNWGVKWRVSSSYYPQSNGRAELAVKTAKRLLRENIAPNGDLNTDRAARAILQYRNTPLQDIGASPAQLLYGRRLRDHLPSFSDALQIRPEWIRLAEDREMALAQRHLRSRESYNHGTKELPDLKIGDHVLVQNQTGNYPNRWDKTGLVVEALPNHQYLVRMDGSGRCSLRNRRFLRNCSPFMSETREVVPVCTTPSVKQQPQEAISSAPSHELPDVTSPPPESTQEECAPLLPPDLSISMADRDKNALTAEQPQTPPPEVQLPRRSARVRKPLNVISMKMTGKSHEYACRP